MRSMEIHLGVVRDKEGIYSALLQSQSMNRQLAVCFKHDGKLLVKICTVMDIVGDKDRLKVILKSHGEDKERETTIPLNRIQSIYPIREFLS